MLRHERASNKMDIKRIVMSKYKKPLMDSHDFYTNHFILLKKVNLHTH